MRENDNWRDVKGYEGLYLVNEFGVIKSVEKSWVTGRGNGRSHTQKSKIKSPFLSRFGYLRVPLWKNNKSKNLHVHAIVCHAFCDGYFEGSQVNHKDGIKTNNHYMNLEFVTASENQQHAVRIGLRNNRCTKKVINISTGETFESIKLAAEENDMPAGRMAAYLRGSTKNKTPFRYA